MQGTVGRRVHAKGMLANFGHRHPPVLESHDMHTKYVLLNLDCFLYLLLCIAYHLFCRFDLLPIKYHLFADSTYYVPCGNGLDGHCANCTAIQPKLSSKYYMAGCSDGGQRDRVRLDRTPMSASCPQGMYRKLGNLFTDNLCVNCSAPCVDGSTYETSPCMSNGNRHCERCSLGACEAGTYESAACTAKNNRICDRCSFVDGCPLGSYMVTDCTPKTDRTCRACTMQCPAGQYMLGQCNETHGAVCIKCSTSAELGCNKLPYPTYTTKCGGMSDSTCAK